MRISAATVAAGVVAITLVGLVAFAAYAFAQTDPGGPPWTRGAAWGEVRHGWGPWHGGGPDPERVRQARAELAADLAGELNVSADAVEAAFRAVVAQHLQEAVDAGEIEQADVGEALAAYDEGDLRVVFRLFKHDNRQTEPPAGE